MAIPPERKPVREEENPGASWLWKITLATEAITYLTAIVKLILMIFTSGSEYPTPSQCSNTVGVFLSQQVDGALPTVACEFKDALVSLQ